MRRNIFVSVVCLALLCLPVAANAGTAEEIIKLTRAQWAAEVAKDQSKSDSILADDYTEFNADFPTLIVGKELNTRFYEAMAKGG